MGSRTSEAVRKWNIEVDAEAARLIESGTPPWTAVGVAVRNVSDQRRRSNLDFAKMTEALRGVAAR
jgi:hypothetical protein